MVIGLVLSALGMLVLVGAARNDALIDAHLGRATAEVLDGSSLERTFVRFTASDGAVLTPEDGVFYPRGLEPGNLVLVEYDTTEPDLVRVAGRDWTRGLVPVLVGVVVVWLVCGPGVWALARSRRRRIRAAERIPAQPGSPDATSAARPAPNSAAPDPAEVPPGPVHAAPGHDRDGAGARP